MCGTLPGLADSSLRVIRPVSPTCACSRHSDWSCGLWGERAQPCNYLGEYCPEGTVNEYSYVQASNCPAGKMCPNTTTMEECKPGCVPLSPTQPLCHTPRLGMN